MRKPGVHHSHGKNRKVANPPIRKTYKGHGKKGMQHGRSKSLGDMKI